MEDFCILDKGGWRMKITYIYHSCFVVELENDILVFDYYKGKLPQLDPSKRIFVFSSHKHYDHFNKEILQLFDAYKDVRYILSDDIKTNGEYIAQGISNENYDKILYIGPDNVTTIAPGFTIRTLTSTDEGVAFYLDINGKIIYHAGDLNWWTWIGETIEEYTDMTNRFKNEIMKLEGNNIDVAFLPLDPRQEDRFCWGFDYFMKHTNTQHAFPMHFQEEPSVIEKLKGMEIATEYKDRIMSVEKEGKEYLLTL